MNSSINPNITQYLQHIENGDMRACSDMLKLIALVRKAFDSEDIYTDNQQLEKYLGLVKYWPFKELFAWEKFLISLHLCTYRSDGMPRWPDLFCLVGRGAGKDGYAAFESMCLTSPYNGIRGYDVDICANNEDQAMRPVKDLIDILDTPAQTKKLRRHYYWTKEEIVSLKTKSIIKGRTNSPKGKDGLRSGCVIFNEIHQYENYANINVFTTGLGKKRHPRRTYITTNGDVRGGPLDDMLETSERILHGGEPDNGLLPFICRLDSRDDVNDPDNWVKANPSLPYLPNLQEETRKEYAEWKRNPEQLPAFMTKRMNLPDENREIAVTEWENIKATNRELPDLSGWSCVAGIDYAKVTDFASVDFHFRREDERFDLNHSWLCLKSADIPRIKAPWREWERRGLLTVVDDVEIHPDLICEYIAQAAQKYNILKLALDNYRYALLTSSLRRIGFDAQEYKNVYLVRPSDVMKTAPVVDSCFANQNYIWGDNPVLRWAANNAKKVRSNRQTGSDTGNYYYAKIEGRSRKTDPFMALVAAMTIEGELGDMQYTEIPDAGVFTY